MGSYHYFSLYTQRNLFISKIIMKKDELRILQVGNVLVSPDIITEKFPVATLMPAKGECCIEGDAGSSCYLWMRLWRLRMRWM